MTKCFLLTIDLPDWADKPDRMEMIREEIEQHGVACAAFYTRASHVVAKCRMIQDLRPVGGEGAAPLSEYEPTGP